MRTVRWLEEEKVLTLTGEPVLACRYMWPETGCKKLDRYYRRVKGNWQRRWERALYWAACLDLAEKRERSRPFVPWSARLLGETTYQDEGLLSLYMEARERRGDGRTLYGRSGDIWEAKTGAPVPVPWRGRRKLCQSLELREEGVLDPDFGEKLGRFFSGKNVCLRPEGLEVWFPQCTIAPAAEGLPTFLSKEVDFLEQTCYNLKK
jgi:hypothetical protein